MTEAKQPLDRTIRTKLPNQDPQPERVSADPKKLCSEDCSDLDVALPTEEDLEQWRAEGIPNPVPGIRSDVPGWVYLLRIVDGPTKIGKTCGADPYRRLADIDQGLPYKTELVAVSWVRDVNRLEKQLHAEHASKRIKGEWFSLDETDLKRLISRHMFMLPNRIKEHLAWLEEHRRDWRKDYLAARSGEVSK